MLLDLTIFPVMQVHVQQHRKYRIMWNVLISLYGSAVPAGQDVVTVELVNLKNGFLSSRSSGYFVQPPECVYSQSRTLVPQEASPVPRSPASAPLPSLLGYVCPANNNLYSLGDFMSLVIMQRDGSCLSRGYLLHAQHFHGHELMIGGSLSTRSTTQEWEERGQYISSSEASHTGTKYRVLFLICLCQTVVVGWQD